MALIARAVKRILEQKVRLDLFENPYVDPEYAVKVTHTNESQDVALNVAREGIVLLKNENNILPLNKNIKKIAIIGPNADNDKNQLGDYTSLVVLQNIVTVLDGIKAKVSQKTKIEYIKGCDVIGNDYNEISKAKNIAKNADLAIVVLGENEWLAPNKTGTDGEGYDVASLDLTGLQEDLLGQIVGRHQRGVLRFHPAGGRLSVLFGGISRFYLGQFLVLYLCSFPLVLGVGVRS